MPRIGVGAKKDDFIPRCISVRQKENPDEDNKQSVAICHQMWRDKHDGKKKK
jgi:hypothetical protein